MLWQHIVLIRTLVYLTKRPTELTKCNNGINGVLWKMSGPVAYQLDFNNAFKATQFEVPFLTMITCFLFVCISTVCNSSHLLSKVMKILFISSICLFSQNIKAKYFHTIKKDLCLKSVVLNTFASGPDFTLNPKLYQVCLC